MSLPDLSGPGFEDLDRASVFVPSYAPMKGERWEMHVVPLCCVRGYWAGPARMIRGMAALTRLDEQGIARSWMSMTPMEIESQEIGFRLARGHTIVMGMGMGWCAANAALNPEVTQVTVVEADPEILSIVALNRVFDQLPETARAKIRIVQGDAMAYRPEQPAETLLADIWLMVNGGDLRVEEVRTMQANTGATRVYFWGQEMELARRARDRGLPLDAATVAALVAETGLPLLGPELPDYPRLIAEAAEGWLKDPIALAAAPSARITPAAAG
ncbi:MAG TPA: hypothetical protein VED40_10920 [Azospirillaceae bacterium]|nr:hypothetical protein [Azospirillaceae bacterium]